MKKVDRVHPESFASGYHFYKMFWVFVISSFLGFMLETISYLAVNGHTTSSNGLIYGPFSQIYGFAAVIMVLILHRIKINRVLVLFLTSALLGGVFEFTASLVQEFIFGSISWDYTYMQFDLFGRTNLLFCFYWGILGVLLIKYIYPFLSRQIEKLPRKPGLLITWILIIFMVFDLSISAAAVLRENQRFHEIPATNKLQAMLDQYYPDSFLKTIYPGMIHVR